jgi:hypothetical protein
MKLTEIKNGTILFCGSQWGDQFAQVVDWHDDPWGGWLECVVVEGQDEEGQTTRVRHVGPVDMKSTGWRLCDDSDLARLAQWQKFRITHQW